MKKWGYFVFSVVIISGCGNKIVEESKLSKIQASTKIERGWYSVLNSVNSSFAGAKKQGDGVMIYSTFPVIHSNSDSVPVPGKESLKKAFIGIPRDSNGVGIQQGWFSENEEYPSSSRVSIWKGHRMYTSVLGEGYLDNERVIYDDVKGKLAMHSGNPNRLDVFARSKKDNLMVISSKDNGKKWGYVDYMGDKLNSDPAVASLGANHLDVFVSRNDNRLWHKWWNGHRWSKWLDLGGVLKSNPVVAERNGKLDVVVYGDDDNLWRKTFDGRQWLGWKRMGPGPYNANTSKVLCAVAINEEKLMVFASNYKGEIKYKVFNANLR